MSIRESVILDGYKTLSEKFFLAAHGTTGRKNFPERVLRSSFVTIYMYENKNK